jgi:hypothetical protein
LTHNEAIAALESLQGPPGWKGSPILAAWGDRRFWEPVGEVRGIVTVVAIGGNRPGWFRVRASACGGMGSEVVATVDAGRLAATLAMACGWVDAITKEGA